MDFRRIKFLLSTIYGIDFVFLLYRSSLFINKGVNLQAFMPYKN